LNNWLQRLQPADLAAWQQHRSGEVRLGATLHFLNPLLTLEDALAGAVQHGCRFALLGIPEDIGPRANLGNGGADLGFSAFLSRFINLQDNLFAATGKLLLAGTIACDDLQQRATPLDAADPDQLTQLRQLCSELDLRVYSVMRTIFDAGLTPIVIGGGHNNALPILQALASHAGQAADAINLDPHCDFRLLEGRHSGNGFSYAAQAGWLRKYFVLGLHELKNSATALQQLTTAGAGFCSYQRIWQRRQITLAQAITQAIDFVGADESIPLGIELDTDSISGMPVSAFTNCGVTVADAEFYVWQLAQLPRVRYLHLAEAAPAQHPAGLKAGMNEAGQVLAALVLAFIQARAAHH
jgi:formiminoglutamase